MGSTSVDGAPGRTHGCHLAGRRFGLVAVPVGPDLARQHRPDLIFLDLHLPDIQGDEVLRQLQLDAATRDIPVIMLSADATPHQVERLLECGASAYLTKPLQVTRFLEVLDLSLEAGRSLRQTAAVS